MTQLTIETECDVLLAKEALRNALELYLDITGDMLYDYRDSEGDLEECEHDLIMLPVMLALKNEIGQGGVQE